MSVPEPASYDNSPSRGGLTGTQKVIVGSLANAAILVVCISCCPITVWYAWDLSAKGKRELQDRQANEKKQQLEELEKVRTQAQTLITVACESYAKKNGGVYPEQLSDLLRKEKGGPYIDGPDGLKDSWGRPYQYDKTEQHIWTLDPAGKKMGYDKKNPHRYD